MRNTVVPHKFDCQTDRKLTHTKPERSAVIKRRKIEINGDIFSPSTSSAPPAGLQPEAVVEAAVEFPEVNTDIRQQETTFKDSSCQTQTHYRSRYVQCSADKKDINLSPIKHGAMVDFATSPIKVNINKHGLEYENIKKRIQINTSRSSSSSSDETESSSTSESICTSTSSSGSYKKVQIEDDMKAISVKRIIYFISPGFGGRT